jgi:hypothetical protein
LGGDIPEPYLRQAREMMRLVAKNEGVLRHVREQLKNVPEERVDLLQEMRSHSRRPLGTHGDAQS